MSLLAVHNNKENMEKLTGLIEKNPELPVVFIVDAEICGNDYGWWYSTDVTFDIGEVLCCEVPWTNKLFDDWNEFEKELTDKIADCTTDEEFEERLNYERTRFRQHWKTAIRVWCGKRY